MMFSRACARTCRLVFVSLLVVLSLFSFGQQSVGTSSLPRIIKYSGAAAPGNATLTFAIYSDQNQASPIWSEVQNVTADEQGRYTVLLGSTTADGLPASIFESGEARWLGVRNGDEAESPRILLVSVPYALKAGDAETLGGKPLSAFLMADPSTSTTTASATSKESARIQRGSGETNGTVNNTGAGGTANFVSKWQDSQTLVNSVIFDDGTNVGIGTPTPHQQLELTGNFRMPASTATTGVFYQGPNIFMHTFPFASGNLFFGVNSGNLTMTGTANLGIGNLALTSLTSGSSNMAFGPSALANNTVGLQNTAIGTQALFNTTSNNNTAIGFNALVADTGGNGNVGVGTTAGQTISTGVFNTFIGYNSDAGSGNLINATAIGANAKVNTSNSVILGLNANVGVGTSAPTFAGAAGGVHVFNSGAADLRLQSSGSTYDFLSINNGAFGLFDANNSAYRLYINNAGTVGIGTTAPTVLTGTGLHISGTSAALRLQSSANSYELINNGTNGNLGLFDVNNAAYRMYITGAGNVGINNTAPVAQLDVSQPAAGLNPSTFTVSMTPPAAVHGDTSATFGIVAGVFGTTSSGDGYGVLGENLSASGSGFNAGVRGITAITSTLGTGVWGDALQTAGDNIGVFGRSASSAGTGVQGQATATSGDAVGVYGTSASSNGTGVFGQVTSTTAGSPVPAAIFGQAASGVAGLFSVTNNTAALLIGTNAAGSNVFRVDSTGKVFADGNIQTSGADFAESVDVAYQKSAYEAGDVIAVDTTGVRRFTKVSVPYSTLVAGIYSTKPGLVATPHHIDDPRVASSEIPLAVVGIVPCKVTNENGDINAGDLLVSSSTSGYAMKGTDRTKMTGAVVGKALQSMHSKSGVIEVLVSLQ
jgi:hypothetical protein